MKFGLVHYNAPGANLEEYFQFLAETGFDCTELLTRDVWGPGEENPERAAEAVRKLADRYGIAVSAFAAGNDFVVLDPDAVKAQVARMERCANIAEILGTKVIRSEGGQPKESVPEEKWVDAMAECFRRCLEWAEPRGIKLSVDNHGLVTNKPGVLPALFEKVPSPCLGTNLDTMNYRWWGTPVEECDRIYAQVAPKVFSTHLKDGFGSRKEYVGMALGEGEIHLTVAVSLLKQAGFKGPWVAEYEARTDKVEGCRKCLEWMKQHIPD
ncbi:MAG: sugar phosphate isomerase/epimerase family protein [Armatimonadota bacterium]|nr:sugar phosphate isomerase/epimerase family protein [Armatimonadota bacterium]